MENWKKLPLFATSCCLCPQNYFRCEKTYLERPTGQMKPHFCIVAKRFQGLLQTFQLETCLLESLDSFITSTSSSSCGCVGLLSIRWGWQTPHWQSRPRNWQRPRLTSDKHTNQGKNDFLATKTSENNYEKPSVLQKIPVISIEKGEFGWNKIALKWLKVLQHIWHQWEGGPVKGRHLRQI